MTSLGQVYVDVLPDLSRFAPQLQSQLGRIGGQAGQSGGHAGQSFTQHFAQQINLTQVFNQQFNQINQQATQTGGRMRQALMQGIGIGAGFEVFDKLKAGFVAAIGGASDLNESMSKTQVVFGQSARSVQDWSQDAATAMGQSKQGALEAAATFGNLLVSLKLPQVAAADMSTKLVQLAGDLASFNNVSPEDALEALRSGLVGETEPLRKFGVNMDDATLKAQALKMGMISNTKEALTPATKAQAAYALIMDQTKTAQGDFGRTSGGLANQQRILTAEFKDTAAQFGTALLPAITAVAQVFTRDLFPVLKDVAGLLAAALGPALRAAGTALTVLVDAVKASVGWMAQHKEVVIGVAAAWALLSRQMIASAVVSGLHAVGSAIGSLQGAFVSVQGAFRGFLTNLQNLGGGSMATGIARCIGLGLAIAGVVAVLSGYAQANDRAKATLDGINSKYPLALNSTQALADRMSALTKQTDTYAGATKSFWGWAAGMISGKSQEAARGLDVMGDAQDDVTRKMHNLNQNARELGAQFGMSTAAVKTLATTAKIDLTDGTGKANAAFRTYISTLTRGLPIEGGAAGAIKKLANETQAAKDKTDAFKESLDKLYGKTLNVKAATAAYQQGLNALSGVVKDNTNKIHDHAGALGGDSDKSLEVQGALRGQWQKTMDLSQATLDQTHDQKQANSVLELGRQQLIKQARQAGISETAIRGFLDELGVAPAKVNDLKGAIDTLKSKGIKVTTNAEGNIDAATRQRLTTTLESLNGLRMNIGTPREVLQGIGPEVDAISKLLAMESGGFLPRSATIARGRGDGLVQWAEGSTGHEAFIPTDESKRATSIPIWVETGRMLGVLGAFAAGGFLDPTASVDVSKVAPFLQAWDAAGAGWSKGGVGVPLSMATAQSLGVAVGQSVSSWLATLADRMLAVATKPTPPADAKKPAPGGPPGLASGGTITSGGYAVIGEEGPELLKLAKGSSVIPASKLPAATTAPAAAKSEGSLGFRVDLAGLTKGMEPAADIVRGKLPKAVSIPVSSPGVKETTKLLTDFGRSVTTDSAGTVALRKAIETLPAPTVKAAAAVEAAAGQTRGFGVQLAGRPADLRGVGAALGRAGQDLAGFSGRTDVATGDVVGFGGQVRLRPGELSALGTSLDRGGDMLRGFGTRTDGAAATVVAFGGQVRARPAELAGLGASLGTGGGALDKFRDKTDIGSGAVETFGGKLRDSPGNLAIMQHAVDAMHGKAFDVAATAKINQPDWKALIEEARKQLAAAGGAFATGGIHGVSLPQDAVIAPAQPSGGLVQWAEPGTGGEAFIPLASDRRERSLEVWRRTGKLLGAFAVGGLLDPDLKLLSDQWQPGIDTTATAANEFTRATGQDFVDRSAAAAGKDFTVATLKYLFEQAAAAAGGGGTGGGLADAGALVAYARSLLGHPYEPPYYGPNAFSCDGLVWWVFNHFGINTGRNAEYQIHNAQQISEAESKPGDVVAFKHAWNPEMIPGSTYGHIGIVTGPNETVNALGHAYGVVTSSITGLTSLGRTFGRFLRNLNPGGGGAGGGAPGPGGGGGRYSQAQMQAAAAKFIDGTAAHALGAIAMAETGGYNFPKDMGGRVGWSHGPWAFIRKYQMQYDPTRLDTDLDYAAWAATQLWKAAPYGPNYNKWNVWGTTANNYMADGGILKMNPGASQYLDEGGWLPPGSSLVVNQTGQPERVIGPATDDALVAELRALPRRVGRAVADALNGVASYATMQV